MGVCVKKYISTRTNVPWFESRTSHKPTQIDLPSPRERVLRKTERTRLIEKNREHYRRSVCVAVSKFL